MIAIDCELQNGVGNCCIGNERCCPDNHVCQKTIRAYFYGMKLGISRAHHAELDAINKRADDSCKRIYDFCRMESGSGGAGEEVKKGDLRI